MRQNNLNNMAPNKHSLKWVFIDVSVIPYSLSQMWLLIVIARNYRCVILWLQDLKYAYSCRFS